MKIPSTNSFKINSMYGNSIAHGQKKDIADTDKLGIQNDKKDMKRPALVTYSSGSERLNNESASPSFTGNPKLITDITKEAMTGFAKGIPSWAQKMGGANWFRSVLKSVNKNEARFEAFIALFVAGFLKPACVLAMPGAEKEDKQMAATKNSVSALLGFGLSNLILNPCSDAVNKITKSFDSKNPTRYIKDMDYIKSLKSEELLPGFKSTLGDAFKTTYKKFADLGVSPMKAALTIAITPTILKFIFGKDKSSKKKEETKKESLMDNSTVFNAIRLQKNMVGKTNTAQPAFTGGVVNQVIELAKEVPKKQNAFLRAKDAYNNFLAEPIAKAMGLASNTKIARKVVEGTAHFEDPSPRWSDLTSIAITYFYVRNTYKSTKIDEERKLPLMINNIMVTVASSLAAFLIDTYTDKPMENLLRGYLKEHDADLLNESNKKIVTALNNALEQGKESIDLDAMKRHSQDLLAVGKENLSQNIHDAAMALKNNEIVQRAIKEKIIDADDILKMTVSGFESQASSIFKNIAKAKSLTIFVITVRFLVTVLMTPVIGRVVALVNKKIKDNNEKADIKQAQAPKPIIKNPETLGIKDFMSMVKK